MNKALDAKLIKSLAELINEKHIDFKNRYFPQEFMNAHWGGYWIPSTIYEILTVLPKILETNFGTYYLSMTHDLSESVPFWYACYRDFEGTIYEIEEATELVDALGKLLIWCILNNWLKEDVK